jgi:hypothetical protein
MVVVNDQKFFHYFFTFEPKLSLKITYAYPKHKFIQHSIYFNLQNMTHIKKCFLAVCLLCLVVWFPTQAQVKMTKRKITDYITAKIPEDFRLMTDQELASKYFTYKKPTVMFTDNYLKVDFGVNENDTEFDYKDLALVKGFYKSSMMRMFTKVQIIKEDMVTINKKQFARFEFISEVEAEKYDVKQLPPVRTYSYILYTIENDKAIIINFSCPASLQKKWQEVAHEIMESVKI